VAGSLPFFFVDVFADAPLTGNPLAVVVDDEGVDVDLMRAIAREFNQSETTFVQASTNEEAAWRLRSFTPAGVEVGGAGHNALGAWWWLADAGRLALSEGPNRFLQEIGGRVLPVEVTVEDGRLRAIAMEQEPAQWGDVAGDLDELAASLGLPADELGEDAPAQVVSTGAPHLLVQVRTREAVDRAVPDVPRLREVLRTVDGEGCYLYSLDPVDPASAGYARFFNPTAGISEDPATGTAAGPLASHLVAHDLSVDDSKLVIEQGHRIGRSSRLEIRIPSDRPIITAVCVIVADGMLHT
jgi:PhzF family phenazine biosynthesis protein